jgi:predicted ATPase
MKDALHTLSAGQARWPFFLGAIAGAEAANGKLGEANELFEEARQVAMERNERWYYAELLRRKAEVRRHMSDTMDESEHHLREAIQVAQKQGAKLWSLRSSLSLAQLWSDEGRVDDAHQLLLPVLEGFAEEPRFAELSRAETLLASHATRDIVRPRPGLGLPRDKGSVHGGG